MHSTADQVVTRCPDKLEGGEDPLKPRIREVLNEAKEKLTFVNQILEVQGAKAAELKKPDETNLAELRAVVERAASSA